MDRDFIARNQIVERYLSGRLPLKAATEFERFCRNHGQLLDEIGLPERVNAGLRLLEASGKPEPWQEAPRPVWQKPQVTLILAAAVVALGMALAIVGAASSSKSHRIAELQKQNSERALDAATSTREIRLLPSRSGASNSPAITIGGGAGAQLADLKIDESRSPYHIFRITIDRIDQGRVAVINNLGKDSNGHLRIALNSSALGPGNYQLTLEGLDWRGQPQPDVDRHPTLGRGLEHLAQQVAGVTDLARHPAHHVGHGHAAPEFGRKLAKRGLERPGPRAYRIGVVVRVDHVDLAQNTS